MVNINQRLKELRSLFSQNKIEGYLAGLTGEYGLSLPNEARLEFITNFSGSNGFAIILDSKVILITDGRYLLQAKNELAAIENFSIVDMTRPINWNKLGIDKLTIGYDPKIFTQSKLKFFKDLDLKIIANNLIDQIWKNKPELKITDCFIYNAGESSIDKLKQFATPSKYNVDYILLSSPVSVCWLLNIRARDLECDPLFLSYALISEKAIYIFTHNAKSLSNIKNHLPKNLTIKDFSLLKAALEIELQNISGKILLDKNNTSIYILNLLDKDNIEIIHNQDPCLLPKSCKTIQEIKGFERIHIEDSVALCEFFAWLSEVDFVKEKITEYQLSEKLRLLRTSLKSYICDSFNYIVGYRENSAIIHYRPLKRNSKIIASKGILLIDSGAHYFGGTTDVTRTITLGKPTYQEKLDYTTVLKGHVALGNCAFPEGASGSNLDVLARQFLWKSAKDFAHGTGHGVGNCLTVHEGPQSINRYNNVPLKEGMILSNEPGYYKANEYGIRIENLVYVTEAGSNFFKFKNLTLLPYCKDLIIENLLNNEEKSYIKIYYDEIWQKIAPLLSNKAKNWLQNEMGGIS